MTKAVMEMENGGVMTLELYPETAPITVENFVKLAKDGFYNGLIFHRVIEGFMIQGGDPTGTGMGGPGYQIKGEFASNGVKNPLKHTRGVISMARSARPDSAARSFSLCTAMRRISTAYAAFGKLTDGFDVLDEIASVDTDYSDKPVKEQKIKTVTIVDA